jgi:uncharacterized membrane protein
VFAQAPSFTLIQPEAGYTQSGVGTISGDGQTAVGVSSNLTGARDFFLWTSVGGRHDFSTIPAIPPGTSGAGISGDGGVVAGANTTGTTTNHTFRYSESGGYQTIGTMPGRPLNLVTGINGDGSVLVGYGQSGTGPNYTASPYRWTVSGGWQNLGTLHPNSTYVVASGVSRDGNVVVGTDIGSYATGPLDAFMWTPQGGMARLAPAVNPPFSGSAAMAVSGDGLTVVGYGDVGLHNHAWRWTQAGGMVDLGLPSGALNSALFHTNYDGSVLIGDMDIGPESDVPILWTEQTGFQRVSDYLVANGVALPAGFRSFEVNNISDDAQTFVGSIVLQDGTRRGYVATVPVPGTLLCLGPVLLMGLRGRR